MTNFPFTDLELENEGDNQKVEELSITEAGNGKLSG